MAAALAMVSIFRECFVVGFLLLLLPVWLVVVLLLPPLASFSEG